MNQPQFTVDLGKPFNLITFVGEREEAEMMISKGWTPVWEPNLKIGNLKIQAPNVSDYFVLVK